MQTQIKFIVSGANSIYGGFSAGDVLRCPENVANHLVAIGVAKFNEAKAEEQHSEPVKSRKKVSK